MKSILKSTSTAALNALVRKPSTENAIKGITAALDELDAVVAFETKTVEIIDAEIAAKVEQQNAARDRLDRAAKIAKRFAKLVA